MDFLRRDVVNINDFFRKKGVHVFGAKRLFEFIVVRDLSKNKERAELDAMIEEINTDTMPEEDESFARMHIPRNLD